MKPQTIKLIHNFLGSKTPGKDFIKYFGEFVMYWIMFVIGVPFSLFLLVKGVKLTGELLGR